MRFDERLTGLIYLLFCLAVPSWADDDPAYQISFSSQQQNGLPVLTEETRFHCSNQIFTIITASNLADSPIQATVIWKNPAQEIQEKTPINLYPVEGKALGWAWLKLHKSTGASLLSFLDDSLGMDEFIGDWQIELLIGRDKVAQETFNILC